MKTKDFLNEHNACSDGAEWALSVSEDMADVWDAMIEQGEYDWLIWTATRPNVFTDAVLRKLACRLIRETPLSDGRKVWNLLTDERSRKAVEVAELYADGKATYEELQAAYAAAYAAYAVARDAASAAAACVAANVAAKAAYATDAAVSAVCVAAARDAVAAAAYAAVSAANAAYAAYDAVAAAAYAAAKAAQIKMITELGNPFKERTGNERTAGNCDPDAGSDAYRIRGAAQPAPVGRLGRLRD